jgi:hypothetical protein
MNFTIVAFALFLGVYLLIDMKLLPLGPLRGVLPDSFLSFLGDSPTEEVALEAPPADGAAPVAQLEAKANPEEISKSTDKAVAEENSEEDADTEQSDDAGYLSDFQPNLLASKPTMEALEEISRWSVQNYSEESLQQYVMHQKTWVRVAALAFVVESDEYEDDYLNEVAKDILKNHSKSQVHRFLQRYRASKPELFQKLKNLFA